MFRRLLCGVLAAALVGFVGACEKPPVSTNKDMPIKTSGGPNEKDKKKSRTMEASLEDPPK